MSYCNNTVLYSLNYFRNVSNLPNNDTIIMRWKLWEGNFECAMNIIIWLNDFDRGMPVA